MEFFHVFNVQIWSSTNISEMFIIYAKYLLDIWANLW